VDLSGLVFDETKFEGFRGNSCERMLSMERLETPGNLKDIPFSASFFTKYRGVATGCPGIQFKYQTKRLKYQFIHTYQQVNVEAEVRGFRGPMKTIRDPVTDTDVLVPSSTITYEWALRQFSQAAGAFFRNGDAILNRMGSRDGLSISLNAQATYTWGSETPTVREDYQTNQGTYVGHPDWAGVTSPHGAPWLLSVQMIEELGDGTGRVFSYFDERILFVKGQPSCASEATGTGGYTSLVYPVVAKTGTMTELDPSGGYLNFQGQCRARTFQPADVGLPLGAKRASTAHFFFWIASPDAISTEPGTFTKNYPRSTGVQPDVQPGSYDSRSLYYVGARLSVERIGKNLKPIEPTQTGSPADYTSANDFNFNVRQLPAGTWKHGVDIVDAWTGALMRYTIAGDVTVVAASRDPTTENLDRFLVDPRTPFPGRPIGSVPVPVNENYQFQSIFQQFGRALTSYNNTAEDAQYMVQAMLTKWAAVRANLVCKIDITSNPPDCLKNPQSGQLMASVPAGPMADASTVKGITSATQYLSVVSSALLLQSLRDMMQGINGNTGRDPALVLKPGQAHQTLMRTLLDAIANMALRGNTLAPEDHALSGRSDHRRRLFTHTQDVTISAADKEFHSELYTAMWDVLDELVVGYIKNHGDNFAHNANNYAFRAVGVDLNKGLSVSVKGNPLNVNEMPASVTIAPVGTVWPTVPAAPLAVYAAEILMTPVNDLGGAKTVTGLFGVRMRSPASAAMPSNTIKEHIFDAGVEITMPLTAGSQTCIEYQCMNWNFNIDPASSAPYGWEASGQYGTAVVANNMLTCRLDGDALVVGACRPRGSVVGDPYVFAPQSEKWVPFHPSNDQLYSLVEGQDFRVQGGFAAATKTSCQCVWVDEDPSLPPRAGNRLAAVIFEFNGGVFHITPTGLFYEEAGGEWVEVSPAEWSPSQSAEVVATGGALPQGASGELSVNDVHITWGAVAQQEAFPWGVHEYTYEFKASVPKAGLITVKAGVDSGINVMDVFFDSQAATPVGGLIGMALESGEAGIESFQSKALPL